MTSIDPVSSRLGITRQLTPLVGVPRRETLMNTYVAFMRGFNRSIDLGAGEGQAVDRKMDRRLLSGSWLLRGGGRRCYLCWLSSSVAQEPCGNPHEDNHKANCDDTRLLGVGEFVVHDVHDTPLSCVTLRSAPRMRLN